MTEESQKIVHSGGTLLVHLKAMFAELLDDAKRDILATYKTLSRRFMPILKIIRSALRAVKRAVSVRIQLLQRLLQQQKKILSNQKPQTMLKCRMAIPLNHSLMNLAF